MKRPCPKRSLVRRDVGAAIARLFARGKPEAAFRHRLAQCLHASDCGRLCERLVKAPGKSSVWCVDVPTGERVELYPALEREDFHCPEGRF